MNAPPFLAVRTVDRWALVAGVTGLLANVLLVVLFMTPADGPYAWTGPANDVVGDVSSLALIPVAGAYIGLIFLFGWVFAAGRAAGRPVRSPAAVSHSAQPEWSGPHCSQRRRRWWLTR